MRRTRDIERTISTLEPLFAFLEEGLAEAGLEEKTAFSIKLSAEELFTNMVRHNAGNGETITVTLDVSAARVLLELTDHDVDPFDPASVPPVDFDQPVAQRQPGGLGMHMVRSLVDTLSYRYRDRDLTVSAEKNLGD